MARIIETENSSRRIIKLSTDDILSVLREYKRIIPRNTDYSSVRNILEDTVMYIPEEV